MANPLDTAASVSGAIEKFCDLLAQFVSGHMVRKYKYRIEAAMNYVFVDNKEGQYANIEEKEQVKLKIHFRKRIFDE